MPAVVSIQLLRFIAAISVVLCHFSMVPQILAGRLGKDPIPLYPLAAGVDLFFLISGFVMVYSSGKLFGAPGASRVFLVRRIARIVPIYWIATLVSIAMTAAYVSPVLREVVLSLLFFPYEQKSGLIQPVHGVGWTLNYEMFFYALFAVALLFPKRIAIVSLGAFMVAFVAVGRLFPFAAAPLKFWSDPIIIEFVIGMAIAVVHGRLRLPLFVRLTIIVAGALIIWFGPSQSGPDRLLLWGLPAALIFAGTILGEQPDFGRFKKLVQLLGDSSYALYLAHPLVLSFMVLVPRFSTLRWMIVLFFVTIVLSIATYLLIERRTTKAVREFLMPATTRAETAAS